MQLKMRNPIHERNRGDLVPASSTIACIVVGRRPCSISVLAIVVVAHVTYIDMMCALIPDCMVCYSTQCALHAMSDEKNDRNQSVEDPRPKNEVIARRASRSVRGV
jgi:hypothetical protein